ncbi:MAG: HPr family phosphocarrier protein [Ruminococcus sp.]|nr:HPr family phosphocarrier protein [Ruminococcus sp.]
MVSENVIVINPEGLHMRPAGELAKFAKAHPDNKIIVCYGGRSVNASSLMQVMMAGINCGAEVTLEVDGKDEKSVLDALVAKFQNGFA